MHNKFSHILFAGMLALLVASQSLAADALPPKLYYVSKVIDGDTFVADDGNISFKVRMAGLDAPESKQVYGPAATDLLRRFIEGNLVSIVPTKRRLDQYNRVLGQVYLGKIDLSKMMIEQGFATYYRPKCRDYPADKKSYEIDPKIYVKAEASAREKHKGMWQEDEVELPCEYRKKEKK